MADGGARPGRRQARFRDVRRHPEVDSTNRVAADLARAGAPDGVVVVADHQTAGRGRRGRSWVAPPGSSLLVSVLLRPGLLRPGLLRPGPVRGPPALTTVACSLAAADAVADVAGFGPALRWPNDLYAGGRKLGGVLAEVVDGGAVVLGLGLNLRWPSGVPEPLAGIAVTAEEAGGHAVDRDEVLAAFLDHLEARDDALTSEAGRQQTLADYRDRCETLGREVRVSLPGGRTLEGVAAGVDDEGRLVLGSRGGTSTLAVGDVEHVATS
jgi:BirA family transcriptional regulator, biotin operon repressor / biotin---[acetyl-CoA-carboxylase] ligase